MHRVSGWWQGALSVFGESPHGASGPPDMWRGAFLAKGTLNSERLCCRGGLGEGAGSGWSHTATSSPLLRRLQRPPCFQKLCLASNSSQAEPWGH